MTKFVSYVSDEAIEKDAQALLAEYAHARGVVIEAPIAIDDIVEKLCLSQTSSGWRLTENRASLSCDEGSSQDHWLDGCRSISVAGGARGRDLDIAAANKCSAPDCS